ncbi:unnamed protein product [Lactuca virosa]|uniref:Uncharacterized protein n=1 Tax=Lactuca virosa TaxID=75947 RepID=A0AAU9LMI9_9ASTR|nr:unnamed protein product [Lactuca virosa]
MWLARPIGTDFGIIHVRREWIQSQRRPPSISDTIQHPPSFLLTATAPPNSACTVNNHWSTSFTHVIVENRFDIQGFLSIFIYPDFSSAFSLPSNNDVDWLSSPLTSSLHPVTSSPPSKAPTPPASLSPPTTENPSTNQCLQPPTSLKLYHSIISCLIDFQLLAIVGSMISGRLFLERIYHHGTRLDYCNNGFLELSTN